MAELDWRFLYYQCGSDDVPLSETFTGSAEEALDFSATLPKRDDCRLLAIADRPPKSIDLPAQWITRQVRERADDRGWDIVLDHHDHGAWHLNPRSAVGYILQRRIGAIVAIRVTLKDGTLLQLIIQDRRDAPLMFPDAG